MRYFPIIKSAHPITSGPFGERHTFIQFDQIVPQGRVQYAFLLAIYDNATNEPCYFVGSEVNIMARQFGGGSHFLGVFEGDGHVNLGDSNDWADSQLFFPKAMELAAKYFNVRVPHQG